MSDYVSQDLIIVLQIIMYVLAATFFILCLFWAASKWVAKDLLIYFLMIIAISLVGSTAGFSGGMSRVGVVGEIVPAALSLIGGLSLYLFGVKEVKTLFLPISVSVFAVTLVVGFSAGANNREKRQTFELIQKHCLELFMAHDLMDATKLQIAVKTHGKVCAPVFQATFATILTPSNKE